MAGQGKNARPVDPDRPRFFGRRKGKTLRPTPQALVDSLLPVLGIAVPQDGQRIDPSALFSAPVSEVWLEVGFGGGEHVADQVRLHPEVGIIASEVFLNGIASLLGHLEQGGITAAVRVFAEDVRLLFPALPDACLGRAFVLFPDPWPKKRHADRRFIGPSNLDHLARLLADGAELRVASDDPVYQEWAAAQLDVHPAFEKILATTDRSQLPADWPQTRYEKKCLAGRAPVFFLYRRRARA